MARVSIEINSLQRKLNSQQTGHGSDAGSSVLADGGLCAEWVRLVNEYRVAVKAYSDATGELSSFPGVDFNRVWARAESLRRASKRHRAALFEHEHKHRCSAVRA